MWTKKSLDKRYAANLLCLCLISAIMAFSATSVSDAIYLDFHSADTTGVAPNHYNMIIATHAMHVTQATQTCHCTFYCNNCIATIALHNVLKHK